MEHVSTLKMQFDIRAHTWSSSVALKDSKTVLKAACRFSGGAVVKSCVGRTDDAVAVLLMLMM